MKISLAGDSLEIVFTGAEQVFALRQKITIPKSQITNVSWHDSFTREDFGTMWRLAGTNIPEVLFAGYFRGQGNNEFLYVDHPKGFLHPEAHNVLVIKTREPFPQRRVLLTLDAARAGEILSWWRAG